MMGTAAATARQNYSTEVETGVNQQIHNELNASYSYLAMANYFNRVEIALPGAAAFFANQSKEEAQHAQKLIDYQNDRGGKVQLMAIPPPTRQEWKSLHAAFMDALQLEKDNNDKLPQLHGLASAKGDSDLTNFLEEFYLREQVIEIQQMARYANRLTRMGAGLGEHLFDQELLKLTSGGGKNDSERGGGHH